MPSFFSGNYKIFKNALGKFIPSCPSKHVITSNNSMIKYDLLHITIFFVNKDLIDYSKQADLHKVQRVIMILFRGNIKEVAPEICAFVPLAESS